MPDSHYHAFAALRGAQRMCPCRVHVHDYGCVLAYLVDVKQRITTSITCLNIPLYI